MKKTAPESTEQNKSKFSSFKAWLKNLFDRFSTSISQLFSWLRPKAETTTQIAPQAPIVVSVNNAEKQIEAEKQIIEQSNAALVRIKANPAKETSGELADFVRAGKKAQMSQPTVTAPVQNYKTAEKLIPQSTIEPKITQDAEKQIMEQSNAAFARLRKNQETQKNLAEIKQLVRSAKKAGMSQPTVQALVTNCIGAKNLAQKLLCIRITPPIDTAETYTMMVLQAALKQELKIVILCEAKAAVIREALDSLGLRKEEIKQIHLLSETPAKSQEDDLQKALEFIEKNSTSKISKTNTLWLDGIVQPSGDTNVSLAMNFIQSLDATPNSRPNNRSKI